jgi:hypothetical protein
MITAIIYIIRFKLFYILNNDYDLNNMNKLLKK